MGAERRADPDLITGERGLLDETPAVVASFFCFFLDERALLGFATDEATAGVDAAVAAAAAADAVRERVEEDMDGERKRVAL